MKLHIFCTRVTAFLVATSLVPLAAQQIPRSEYLQYVPLEYPRLQQQTPASASLNLYGDSSSPDYHDLDPMDGIDDRRHAILERMAVRFAPDLVQNTSDAPMDWMAFMNNQATFPLHVDTWNISAQEATVANTDAVDWVALGDSACDPAHWANLLRSSPASDGESPQKIARAVAHRLDDCKLVALVNEFHPRNPKNELLKNGAIVPDPELFKVLYFDFPGHDPETWQQAYESGFTERLRRQYLDAIRIYAHPFIAAIRSNAEDAVVGYELVMQYWLFYPTNDGGNNHEGDWEHVNVIISRKDRVRHYSTAEDIEWMLQGNGLANTTDADALVIKRAEIYFHHFVMLLDYSSPNVYQPKAEWRKEVGEQIVERVNEKELWEQIRYLAYLDKEETQINTHPFCYIGADNKGFDQILALPGGKNRNSHGTYPFSGLYKNIGPSGASEEISAHVDHRNHYKRLAQKGEEKPPRYKHNNVVSFADPKRIKIIPDWERVIDLVESEAAVRREWSWLVLPIRWGYPATVSPFAGIIKHTETGNLSPVGPTYSTGWNRTGASAGFHLYEPHQLPSLFPLGLQDSFVNNLGFLNLTYPVLINLPPFDFAWRIVAYPFRALLGRQEPIYYPKEGIPFRFVGLSAGVSGQKLDEGFVDLYFNPDQFTEWFARLLVHLSQADSTTQVLTRIHEIDRVVAPVYQVVFHIGDRFTSENTLRHSRSNLRFGGEFSNLDPWILASELNMWEYAGSIRYSLNASNIQPFLRAGYGLSWYRLEKSTINGELMQTPNSPWVRKPSLSPVQNLLPNTFHLGGGLELIALKSAARLPRGIDLSLRLDYDVYFHKLGLDISNLPLRYLQLGFANAGDLPQGGTVTRQNASLTLTLSF